MTKEASLWFSSFGKRGKSEGGGGFLGGTEFLGGGEKVKSEIIFSSVPFMLFYIDIKNLILIDYDYE